MNTTQSVKEILSSDFILIIDAVRRLEDGTFRLLDDDKVAATDLFQRLKLAIKDHVTFEESNLSFIVEYMIGNDKVSDALSSQIKEEHKHITGLLEAAEHELFQAHPLPFQSIIKSVKIALHSHLQIEEDIPFQIWSSTIGEAALKRMIKRAQDGFLGLEYGALEI